MATRNDVTGDALVSRYNNDQFRDNYDKIFGKKDRKQETEKSDALETEADCGGSQHAGS